MHHCLSVAYSCLFTSRLCNASDGYHRTLSKKKVNESNNETDKLLPVDNLGAVMISHGEEFGDESTFGQHSCWYSVLGD